MDRRAVAWKEQGNTYYKQKRFHEALGCYAEAVRIDPRYSDAWHNLGLACKALGYEQEAKSCFEKEKKYADISIGRGFGNPLSGPAPDPRSDYGKNSGSSFRKRKRPLKAGVLVTFILFMVVVAAITIIPGLVAQPGQTAVSIGIPDNLAGNGVSLSGHQVPGPAVVKNPAPAGLKSTPLPRATNTVPQKYPALKTGAVSKSFPYILRGQTGTVNLTLYKGVITEIRKEDPYCYVGKIDRYQKFIDLPVQDPFLLPLVDEIRSKTGDPDDQVRIAVSLVQKIPYDKEMIDSGSLEIRYPYQTLFDNEGVCCEKSVLLAYILRELGYGTVLFDFPVEQHTAVGIRVAPPYAYKNTGYAFVETTTPSIISDGNGDYPGFGRIRSAPDVLPVTDGKPFDSIREEWNDSAEWDRLDSLGPVLDKYDYHSWQTLCRKYGIVPG
jgi:tetratricopeptide (TPR) repeat protein